MCMYALVYACIGLYMYVCIQIVRMRTNQIVWYVCVCIGTYCMYMHVCSIRTNTCNTYQYASILVIHTHTYIHTIHLNTYQYIQYKCILADTFQYVQCILIRINTSNTDAYLPIRIYIQYMQYTPICINTCNTYAYVYTYNTY